MRADPAHDCFSMAPATEKTLASTNSCDPALSNANTSVSEVGTPVDFENPELRNMHLESTESFNNAGRDRVVNCDF